MKKSFLTLLTLLVLASLVLTACGGATAPQDACRQDLVKGAECAHDLFSWFTTLVECQRNKSFAEGLACFFGK